MSLAAFCTAAFCLAAWHHRTITTNPWVEVGNCDIDHFILHHRFCVKGSKFPKFERDQNVSEIF
jgi:hypothetical protein